MEVKNGIKVPSLQLDLPISREGIHDKALERIALGLVDYLQPNEKPYADIPGMRVTDNPPSTVSIDTIATSARPDIVITSPNHLLLIELTVPYNSPDCLQNAKSRKERKEIYQRLMSDLNARNFPSKLVTGPRTLAAQYE